MGGLGDTVIKGSMQRISQPMTELLRQSRDAAVAALNQQPWQHPPYAKSLNQKYYIFVC